MQVCCRRTTLARRRQTCCDAEGDDCRGPVQATLRQPQPVGRHPPSPRPRNSPGLTIYAIPRIFRCIEPPESRSVDLNAILSILNDQAADYDFGRLQDIRMARRPLQRRPSRHPFGSTDKEWAHHIGGREELQFNVGGDEGLLRWGIAISLQPSRSLPDVTVLHSRLSSVLEIHGDHLRRLGFAMWDWTGGNGGRSRNRPPQRVGEDLYRAGAFTFVGKQAPFEAFDPSHVLRDFDILLPVYEFVEFEPDAAPPALYPERGFVFEPDPMAEGNDRPRETTARRTAGVAQVSLRHGVLQEAPKRELTREGAVVATENRDGRGGYIDLVASRNGEYEFYEIKTDTTPRLAIRHAIGQLLEYAYWPSPVRPRRLVVVAEQLLDAEVAEYLRTLEMEMDLSISYRQVNPGPK